MANEKVDGREMTWRSLFPWTELFRGFQLALDLNKLLLAAAGIFVMALGWWVLSLTFGAAYSAKPDWPGNYITEAKDVRSTAWERFKRDREQWNLMHEAANVGGNGQVVEPLDLAETPDEADKVKAALDEAQKAEIKIAGEAPADKMSRVVTERALDDLVKTKALDQARAQVYREQLGKAKRAGALSTWPWFENRGPNPFLLVTRQAGIPWEPGHFWDWFLRDQLLVVLEPLDKLVRPVVYFFSPGAEGLPRLYFFLVFVWTVATWSVFGGAITRIAAVQVARGEKIGLMDAVNFTLKRIVSYLTAPLFPIGFILVLIVFSMIFGVVQLIPFVGDFFSGVLWPIPLVLGLLISVTLVGLVVGWPLMSPTISAEGTDSWEAVSRSLSYVFQKPFHYLWYSLVAIAYGAILIFFIGFMASFAVYMGKWAVSQTPFSSTFKRDPTYLMVYAPESFGWRALLLQGAKVDGENVVKNGKVDPDALARYKSDDDKVHKEWQFHFWNTCGAALVGLWLGLVFLMVIGFGYSFFWCSITIIYMLMRKIADGAELDEVYLEEDETDGVFGGSMPPAAPAPAPAAKPLPSLSMVEPPALRTPPPPPISTPVTTPPITELKTGPAVSTSAPPITPGDEEKAPPPS